MTGTLGERSGSGPLASNDDQDTWYFTAQAGDILTASSSAFSVDLHDVSEAQLIEATPTDGSTFEYTFTEAGDYWVHVYQGKGNYTLKMDMVTPADLSGGGDPVDSYAFEAAPGDVIRLAADTQASRSTVALTLFEYHVESENNVEVATSAATALLDATVEYTVPGSLGDPTKNYTIQIQTGPGTPSEFDVDYGIVVTTNAVLDLERNDSTATAQAIDSGIVVGSIGALDADVLWIGSTTPDEWNDGTFNVTQVALVDLDPLTLSNYDVIYIDSNAGVPTAFADAISTFVSNGGGLVTENGGNEGEVDYSWVPNADSNLTWSTELSDDNRMTDLGRVHPVTAGIVDAGISNLEIAQHNVFPNVGNMDALATDAAGVANILADDFGSGRLVYLGIDLHGHQAKGEAHRLIRQALKWSANQSPEADFYTFNLLTGDEIDLAAVAVASGGDAFVNDLQPGVRLHTPSGTIELPTHTATVDGTYYVETYATTAAKGDYLLTVDITQAPLQPGITVSRTSGLVTTEAGGTDSFTVVLDTEPTANVTIDLYSDNTDEGTVSPASLTFTTGDWNMPQTVTVTGVDDPVDDPDVVYFISATAAVSLDTDYVGLIPDDVAVTNLDNETPAGLVVDGIAPNTMAAGATIDVTISGSGFMTGASVTFTNGAGPTPNVSSIMVNGEGTSITATVRAHKKAKVSTWDVVVTNTNGSTGTCSSCFGIGIEPSVQVTNQRFTTPSNGSSGEMSQQLNEETAAVENTLSTGKPLSTGNPGSHARAVDGAMTAMGEETDHLTETSVAFESIGSDLWEELVVAQL